MIRSTVSGLISELSERRSELELDEAALYTMVDKLVVPHIALGKVSKLILGSHWKSASEAQRQALEAIVRGEAGGPLSMMKPMIANFAGIETGPIEFTLKDNKRTVKVPGLIEIGVEGFLSRRNNGEPFYIDNVGHPVNSRLALGIATASHAHVPGIDWDDTTGSNNGHFAPFSWSGNVQPTAYRFDRKAAS